ncbi:pentapeptide repeat-containing protein [Amycolatopsis sp. H6(2020)]|nr:pentapeptide repeat-containing protein [Amycolatopsis sp. H6(2020)]
MKFLRIEPFFKARRQLKTATMVSELPKRDSISPNSETSRINQEHNRDRRPIWLTVTFAALICVLVFFIAWTLLRSYAGWTTPLTRAEGAEIVRTALTVVAGAGGIVALVVAYRRQTIAEEAHRRQYKLDAQSEYDAQEKRVTELYMQAVTQLANSRAPVRIGGMYALERLAQDNPAHRQTVVNLLCAYLRTPINLSKETIGAFSAFGRHLDEDDNFEVSDEVTEELHVRFAAQRILLSHFRRDDDWIKSGRKEVSPAQPSNKNYWPSVVVDLSDTRLIHFNARGSHFEEALFERVHFLGDTYFDYSYIGNSTRFDNSSIDGIHFRGATFAGSVRFYHVKFDQWADFDDVTFQDAVTFNAATFRGVVSFRNANWAIDPAADFQLLAVADHLNLSDRSVRIWPPGWQVRVNDKNPNIGALELISDARPLSDGERIEKAR